MTQPWISGSQPSTGPTARFHTVAEVLKWSGAEAAFFEPDLDAAQALSHLLEEGLGQLPVVVGSFVLGVFSLRSYAEGSLSERQRYLAGATVEDYIEKPEFVGVGDDLAEIIGRLENRTDFLVGDPENYLGQLSYRDVLSYLDRVARPFWILQEIELTLRNLLRSAATPEQLYEAIKLAMPPADATPEGPEDMPLGSLVRLATHGKTFQAYFSSMLGGDRDRCRQRLEPIVTLRNEILHFRSALTATELSELTRTRDWLFRRFQVFGRRMESPISDSNEE